MTGEFSILSLDFDDVSGRLNAAFPESGLSASLTLPIFNIDNQKVDHYSFLSKSGVTTRANGVQEQAWTFQVQGPDACWLDIVFRGFSHSPVMRFKYRLRCDNLVHLTKPSAEDELEYFRLASATLGEMNLAEIQLSHFDPVAHAYMPDQVEYSSEELASGLDFVGPISIFNSTSGSILTAYEHGADNPNSFLKFYVEGQGSQRSLILRAVKGNYHAGQPVAPGGDWESIWFDLALYPSGVEAFLPVYRSFFLDEVCINQQSRKPYLFYNTWNYQEREKYFHNRPYLADMNAGRMLQEIDVAHRLGVDVFVIDTGWYIKSGDWVPNRERFPEGLQEIKRRLDQYGMKLGLWFNPTVAALTSRIFQEHPEYEQTWQGQPRWRGQVWETEESAGMCLASGYADDFVETMVRLNHDLGVTYFKWDGVSQYGCDSPLHNHGTETNSPQERADCFAFESGRAMIHIVEEVSKRCPDVIVDFDVTEGGRFVGLGFLSVGKFFLVNNGPYFHDFNIPPSVRINPDTINVFFYPGPARPRICRQGLKFDPFIPSILFLTHYLPDGPRLSQANSLAALVLGGNGVWGDLPTLSDEEVAYFGNQVRLYKQVRDAVTRAYPKVKGFAGSSPEIHEKIDPLASCGIVVFFTVTSGRMTHITQKINPSQIDRIEGADEWEVTRDGRLKLSVDLAASDARIVYIIAKQ